MEKMYPLHSMYPSFVSCYIFFSQNSRLFVFTLSRFPIWTVQWNQFGSSSQDIKLVNNVFREYKVTGRIGIFEEPDVLFKLFENFTLCRRVC